MLRSALGASLATSRCLYATVPPRPRQTRWRDWRNSWVFATAGRQARAQVRPEHHGPAIRRGPAPLPARPARVAGTLYAFATTLLVGANPNSSPFDADFDPHAVPRIRGTSWHGGRTPLTGTYWLDHLDADRYEALTSAPATRGTSRYPKCSRTHLAARYRRRLVNSLTLERFSLRLSSQCRGSGRTDAVGAIWSGMFGRRIGEWNSIEAGSSSSSKTHSPRSGWSQRIGFRIISALDQP